MAQNDLSVHEYCTQRNRNDIHVVDWNIALRYALPKRALLAAMGGPSRHEPVRLADERAFKASECPEYCKEGV